MEPVFLLQPFGQVGIFCVVAQFAAKHLPIIIVLAVPACGAKTAAKETVFEAFIEARIVVLKLTD